ncbi:MAG: alpha/beta hydrolase, partial [Bacillota bacterium]|nr:alpha/beta hydrolase [Bacillota bacterium]
MKKILLAIGALVTAVIAIGIVFSNMILFIKKKTDEDIIK